MSKDEYTEFTKVLYDLHRSGYLLGKLEGKESNEDQDIQRERGFHYFYRALELFRDRLEVEEEEAYPFLDKL